MLADGNVIAKLCIAGAVTNEMTSYVSLLPAPNQKIAKI